MFHLRLEDADRYQIGADKEFKDKMSLLSFLDTLLDKSVEVNHHYRIIQFPSLDLLKPLQRIMRDAGCQLIDTAEGFLIKKRCYPSLEFFIECPMDTPLPIKYLSINWSVFRGGREIIGKYFSKEIQNRLKNFRFKYSRYKVDQIVLISYKEC